MPVLQIKDRPPPTALRFFVTPLLFYFAIINGIQILACFLFTRVFWRAGGRGCLQVFDCSAPKKGAGLRVWKGLLRHWYRNEDRRSRVVLSAWGHRRRWERQWKTEKAAMAIAAATHRGIFTIVTTTENNKTDNRSKKGNNTITTKKATATTATTMVMAEHE